MTAIIDGPRALRAACDELRLQGARVGFVPTMGALHDGHLSLVDAARAHGAGPVVVSIFVNPLQFGAHEDFGKYPRTFERDLELCRSRGVDLVYAPDHAAMYPDGFQTKVEVGALAQGYEAAVRPTHFAGVTTVVAKLLSAVGPCVACFGRKDYQQWRVIERMVRDLDLPFEIIGCPIAREPDGLAMSSRNRYLDPSQRARATAIIEGLRAADQAWRGGERQCDALVALARAPIAARFDAIDYVTLADADTLVPREARASGPSVLLVAARVGATRLLDNAVLGIDAL